MPRLLLHVCCGPCSLMPILRLREEGWEITAFFYNPNIHPREEWERRREAMCQAAKALQIPLVMEGEASLPALWLKSLGSVTREGERCRLCYRPRMERTAVLAAAQGFAAFTTSLLYSVYQHHESIRAEAEVAAVRCGANFLYRDFRPWWKEGIALSRELGLYRQKWCGCILSRKEALAQREAVALRRAEEKKEKAARLATEEEARRLRREERYSPKKDPQSAGG